MRGSGPGVGVTLLNRLVEKMGSVFIVGGAPAARQIQPKIGFRQAGVARVYTRWVRPWREFQVRRKSFRSVLRLLVGLVYSLCTRRPFVGDWDSIAVKAFDPSLQKLLNRQSVSFTCGQRTVENLNYMLQCPTVEMKGFLLRRRESVVGYFILGKAGWEGRMVDILIDSDGPQDWKLAYATAALTLMREPEVCRIRAWATAAPFSDALAQNGFWLQSSEPIVVRDPKNGLAGAFPINLQLFDAAIGKRLESRGHIPRRHDQPACRPPLGV